MPVPEPVDTWRLACEVEQAEGNWARGVWTALAHTLALPLLNAMRGHLAEHGCCLVWLDCEDAQRLYGLLPDGMHPPIATEPPPCGPCFTWSWSGEWVHGQDVSWLEPLGEDDLVCRHDCHGPYGMLVDRPTGTNAVHFG